MIVTVLPYKVAVKMLKLPLPRPVSHYTYTLSDEPIRYSMIMKNVLWNIIKQMLGFLTNSIS